MSAIVHKSAFCGERGALVGGLNPRPVLLCNSSGGCSLVPCGLHDCFLPTGSRCHVFLRKDVLFKSAVKQQTIFETSTQLPWKKWSVWCLYTYVLMVTSVTWNFVFFIKITWSRSHSSSYAQIRLAILHAIGRENLQNWSQLWFKLFIPV